MLQEKIELEYIKTEQQIAGLFKKGSSVNKFESFCQQLGMAKTRADVKKRC